MDPQVVDEFLEQELRRLRVPGAALALITGGQVLHTRGFGRARPAGETPDGQTPFRIASLTKSMTALAVLQLVDAGMVDLDATVQRYLPWFRVADAEASQRITVRHLLNQTSGLPRRAGEIVLTDFDQGPTATERQVRSLARCRLANEVGTTFEYSNVNYNILGLIIEAASGERFEQYLREHIFDPLGMQHTSSADSRGRHDGLAMGHRYWFGLPVAARRLSLPHGSLPAGGLVSTVDDLSRYLTAILNGGRVGGTRILSEDGMEQWLGGTAEFRVGGRAVGSYAMGWFATELAGQPILQHSGTLPDFAAFMALLPGLGRGMVLLTNANHHLLVPVFIELGVAVAAMLADEQPAADTLRAGGRVLPLLSASLLVPALQIAGVAAKAPPVVNLLPAAALVPVLGPRRRYLMIYLPDLARIALVSGGIAWLWGLSWVGKRLADRRPGGRPNPTSTAVNTSANGSAPGVRRRALNERATWVA